MAQTSKSPVAMAACALAAGQKASRATRIASLPRSTPSRSYSLVGYGKNFSSPTAAAGGGRRPGTTSEPHPQPARTQRQVRNVIPARVAAGATNLPAASGGGKCVDNSLPPNDGDTAEMANAGKSKRLEPNLSLPRSPPPHGSYNLLSVPSYGFYRAGQIPSAKFHYVLYITFTA